MKTISSAMLAILLAVSALPVHAVQEENPIPGTEEAVSAEEQCSKNRDAFHGVRNQDDVLDYGGEEDGEETVMTDDRSIDGPMEETGESGSDSIIEDIKGHGDIVYDWEFDPRWGGTYYVTAHARPQEGRSSAEQYFVTHLSVENEYGDDVKADGGDDWIRFREPLNTIITVHAVFEGGCLIDRSIRGDAGSVETLVNGKPGSRASAGEEVTVIPDTPEGYVFEGFAVHDSDSVTIPYERTEQGSYQFVMPDNPVTIEGEFRCIYHISVANDAHSQITVCFDRDEVSYARAEDGLTYSISFDKGYETDVFEIRNDRTGEVISADPECGAFTMPDSDITITLSSKMMEGVVTYYDGEKEVVIMSAIDLKDVKSSPLTAGWYVVTQNMTLSSRLEINGYIHLILCDDCTLTAQNGVHDCEGNGLIVHGQINGTGTLNVTSAPDHEAAIGGNDGENGGLFIMRGGNVLVEKSGYCAAGIGGGRNGTGGEMYFDRGNVNVNYISTTNGGGAGIGGGEGGHGGEIYISGGTITARGSGGKYYDAGAGIGGGDGEWGNKITITGGTVTAIGGSAGHSGAGAGIGGGDEGSGGKIYIYDGLINATGGKSWFGVGAGIGGGDKGNGGFIYIYGGDIKAVSPFNSGIFDDQQGAGIGGGNDGYGVSIEITGGRAEGHGYEAFGKGNGADKSGYLFLGDNIWAGERDNIFPYDQRYAKARIPEVYLIERN